MTIARLVLLLALTTACAGSAAAPGDVPYGERFDLKAGETMAVGDDGLRVTFERISLDSRCPIDANCVHAGEAVAVIRFELDGRSATRELSTARNRNTASYQQYRAELLSVLPSRQSDRQIDREDYVVQLRITRS